MKKWYSKTGKYIKGIIAVFICFSILMSAPMGFSSVSATEADDNGASQKKGTTTSDSADTTNIDANGTLGKNSDVGIEVTKSITGKVGKDIKVAFKLKSNDTTNVRLKCVYPVIDTTFPFETSGDAYKVISAGNDAEKQLSLNASFSMKTRSDITTGYHSVRFIGEYTKTAGDGTTADYYVIKTINIYFADGTSKDDSSGKTPVGNTNTDDDSDDDGYDGYDGGSSSGGSSGSGGGSDTESTAPKLLITGYDTKPEKIMAGEKFTLTVHIKNTSKSTSLNNGKFLIGNEAGNFLPTSGSSAVFIESIPAGKTGDLKIELKTASDLAQKNYILVVKGDFDDGKGNNFTSSDNLSVPVYQEIKLGVTDVTMTPDVVGVGSEANLMFTINNQGNAGVYNVNVSVKDDAVTCQDSYVGNIAASSSAYASLSLTGAVKNEDKGTIKVEISYEDSEGNADKIEQEVACVVSDSSSMDFGEDGEMLPEDEEEGFFRPIFIIPILVVLAIIITIIIVVVVKHKKKKDEELFGDDDDIEDDENDDIEAEDIKAEDGEDDIENEDF